MKYRVFPKNKDIKVSEVGFGVWSVATNWWGVKDEKMAIDLLQYSSNLGVNFYDTADVYGLGYGETILSKAFSGSRDKRVYATKFGYDIDSGVLEERTGHTELRQKFSSKDIRYSCEQSLKRLQTDYIDIYQLHNPRLDFINSDEVIDTLENLVKEGKIRSYAMALGPDIGWLQEGLVSMNHNPIALHIIYNLLEQEPMKLLFDKARRTKTGLMVRVPHASGLLDGSKSWLRFNKKDHRSHRKRMWMDAGIDVLRDFDFLLEEGRTMGQAAILFALAEESVCSVFPNFTKRVEIDEFCASSDMKGLEEEELEKIENLWVKKHAKMLTSLVTYGDSSSKPTPRK
jgi:aryl-alcohol dehydrogenase-like predicted oxidoreductase